MLLICLSVSWLSSRTAEREACWGQGGVRQGPTSSLRQLGPAEAMVTLTGTGAVDQLSTGRLLAQSLAHLSTTLQRPEQSQAGLGFKGLLHSLLRLPQGTLCCKYLGVSLEESEQRQGREKGTLMLGWVAVRSSCSPASITLSLEIPRCPPPISRLCLMWTNSGVRVWVCCWA